MNPDHALALMFNISNHHDSQAYIDAENVHSGGLRHATPGAKFLPCEGKW
jgi:hypothetical protein